jgi:ribosomal protein S27AE
VFDGGPCLRYRCPGTLTATVDLDLGNYYRGFYRTGNMRRVIARPHTGHLPTREREALEADFREDTKPDAPNVLTATPTLEMGIDIGDLSAVMLTSVPRTQAAHAQRIGRAGRITGNSLVTTFAGTDPMSLYYLAEPDLMLSGDIAPPDCNLDAGEILNRHLLAYFVDLHANGTLGTETMPDRAGKLIGEWGKGGWLDQIVTEVETNTAQVDTFLDLFGNNINPGTRQAVTAYATTGLRARVDEVVVRWRAHLREYENRSKRMYNAIKKITGKDTKTKADTDLLKTLAGERKSVDAQASGIRRERTIDLLERSGLMPNYTLTDETVTFDARLWYHNPDATDDEEEFPVIEVSVARSVGMAIRELAPGATFYAGAYKLTVDTIDIGPTSEPLYRSIRLCPECGWSVAHAEGDKVSECGRCGQTGIADQTNVRRLLTPSRVSTVVHEPQARIYDESDDRVRRDFQTVTTVDIDPGRIFGTWKHDHLPFAFEYTDAATIRTVNAGPTNRPAATKARIGGAELNAPWFDVCRHCGIVRGVNKPDRDGTERHHGFCTSRQGKEKEEKWDTIGLYHETVTEAVRILLPIGDVEDRERLASFKALLMLGLRRSFGGNPDHIRIIETDFPTPDPDQRQYHLVVHDTVTGGTGYLTRLTDPDVMRQILTDARSDVATCGCAAQDKPACHRCLLSVADRRDVPNVTRTAAIAMIDPILNDWAGGPTATNITGLDVSQVKKSELEIRFKKLLHLIDGRTLPSGVTCEVTHTSVGKHTAFEIRFARDGSSTRWRITEQAVQTPQPGLKTYPDFYATRLDDTATPDVAIYLDGFRWHAHPDNNRLVDDNDKRDALRDSGTVVWNATWSDIHAMTAAWKDTVPTGPLPAPPPSTALPATVVVGAEADDLNGGDIRQRARANPFLALLEHLTNPDGWNDTARAITLAWAKHLMANTKPVSATPVEDPYTATNEWAETGNVTPDASGATPAAMLETTSPAGLPMTVAVTKDPTGPVGFATRIPAADSDLTDDDHPARWTHWLHLANTMQFLDDGISRHRQSTTTPSTAPTTTGPTGPATPPDADLAAAIADLMLVGEDVENLVVAAVKLGATIPAPGHEPDDGIIFEAAWIDARTGIVGPDLDPIDIDHIKSWAAANGWAAHTPDGWTAETLHATIKEND